MTLYELLEVLNPCTLLNFQISNTRYESFNVVHYETKIHAHSIQDDILESTLKNIKVEIVTAYDTKLQGLPYLKIYVDAKDVKYLSPLTRRLDIEKEWQENDPSRY